MKPPEFTDKESIRQFILASKEVTRIIPVELKGMSGDGANLWLARRWDTYYTLEQQEAIIAAWVRRRLSR